MILAVDTSIGSTVALVEPSGRALVDLASEKRLGHAEVIGTLLRRAFAESGTRPEDVTHVATGMGPGPFTGLRIGIAAARAFALARAVPEIPVVSHDAAALAAGEDRGPEDPFAIVTDARRRENAFSVYRGRDAAGLPVRLLGPALRPRDADLAADPQVRALGAHPELLTTTAVSAASVGRLAALRLAAGIDADESAAPAEPVYLRSPDVTAGHVPKKVGV